MIQRNDVEAYLLRLADELRSRIAIAGRDTPEGLQAARDRLSLGKAAIVLRRWRHAETLLQQSAEAERMEREGMP